MSVAAKTREDTASMTKEHKFLGGTCVSKNLDETVRLQSEIREERLQRIAEGASSAPVWLAHQPSRFPVEMSVQGPIVA